MTGKTPRGRQFNVPWIDDLKDLYDKRDPHVQTILEQFFPDRPEFHGTQFIAYIVKDIKTHPNGETTLTLTVPFEFQDEVQALTKALTVPLSVDIQVWKLYQEAVNGEVDEEGEDARSRLAESSPDSNGKEAG